MEPPDQAATHLPISVAFLILAHGNPQQLARLVNALPRTSPIFVHFDRRASDSVYGEVQALLKSRPFLHLVKREKCWWASFGIVAGTINLIQAAVGSRIAFDYA